MNQARSLEDILCSNKLRLALLHRYDNDIIPVPSDIHLVITVQHFRRSKTALNAKIALISGYESGH